MPTLEVEIKTVGATEAATDIKDVGDAAKQAGGDIKSAGSDIGSTSQSLSSFKSNLAGVVGSFTAVSTGVLNLVRNFTQLEQAQVRLDTANRRVETSAQAVETAQKKLNDAIAKFGPNSTEAAAAAGKLKTAVEGHQIAVDRAQLQQTKFNEELASLATEIAPNVIGVFGSIIGAISSFTTKGEGGVTLAGKLKTSFTDLVGSAGSLEQVFARLSSLSTPFGVSLGAIATAAAAAAVAVVGLYGDFLVLSDSIQTAQKASTLSSSQMITEWGEFGKRLQAIDFSTPQAALDTIAKHLADFSGIMSNVWIIESNLQDQTKKTTTEWDLFGVKLGTTQGNLVGLGSAISSFVTDKLGQLKTALTNLPSQIGDLGAQLWAKITTGWQDLNAWISTNIVKPIQNFPNQIGALGSQIWSKIVQGWTDITNWVDTNITKPLTGFLDRLTGKGGDIWTKLSNGWKEITDWVSTHIVKPLEDFPTNLAKKGSEIWTKLSDGWTDLTKWVQEHITDPLSKFPDQLKALGAQIWDKLISGWKGITDWIKTNITDPISNLPTTLPALGKQIYDKIVSGFGDFGKFLQDNIINPLKSLATAGQGGGSAGLDALTKLEDSLKKASAATGGFTEAQKTAKIQLDAMNKVTDDLSKKNTELAGTIQGMNTLLTTQAGQQQLITQGTQQQVNALQQQEAALISGTAALQQYNQQLTTGVPQETAFLQGMVDFGNAVNDAVTKTANLAGQFTAFASAAGNAKDMLAQFNLGFTQGLADVQKWAEGIANAKGSMDGVRAGLQAIANLWGVELPKSITLSNDQLKQWIEIIHGAPAEMDALDKAASASFGDVVKEFDKLRQATNQKDMFKTMSDNLQEQINKFGGLLPQLTTKIASEVSSMTDTLNKGIAQMGADLTAAKLTVGPINTQSIDAAKKAMDSMVQTLNVGFSGALKDIAPKFQPLINDIQKFGDQQTSVQGVEKAMGLFKLAVDAALNPTSQTAQAMLTAGANAQGFAVKLDPATGALRLVATTAPDATKGVGGVGTAANTAAPLVNDFNTALGSVGTTIQTFMQSLPQNISDQLSGIPAAIQKAFVDPFTTGLGSIGTTVQTGMQAIVSNLPGQLAGIAAALQTGLVTPFTTAMGQVGTNMQTAITALGTNIGAQLQPSVTAGLQTGLITPFTTAMGQIGTTVQTGMQALASNISAQLAGVSQAVQTSFVTPFVTGMGQIGSTIQTGMQALAANIGAQLAGVGAAVQTSFVQPFITGMGQIGSTVQTGMQALAANIGAQLAGVSQAVQTGFVQPFVTGMGQIGSTVQTGMQALAGNIGAQLAGVGQSVQSGLVQPFVQGMGSIGTVVQQQMNNITQMISQAMQSAGQAVQQFIQALNQIPRSINVTVNVDTSAAQQKIAALQQQLNALNQGVAGGGYPTTSPYGYPVYGATGGEFALTPGGFKRTQRGDELHAAQGGSFIVTKQTRLANLTVGEGNKPELLTFRPGKSGHGIGLLIVPPIPKRKLHAQAGGAFPVFGSAPGPGLFPGAGFPTGNPLQYPGAPIDYGAGLPVPVQGQGGVPETTLGQYGAPNFGTITGGGAPFPGFGLTGGYTIEPQTGLPIEYGAGGQPTTPTPAQIGASPSTGTAANVSPYEMAQMTGQSVASAQAPQQRQMQQDIAELLAAVRRLIAKISMRDINANLMIDGQKMASTVSKYIGSGAYGGR